ncbi:hypothetical protein DOTSEDRAFT_73589, partial [Dothistroma septosporum NZE10]
MTSATVASCSLSAGQEGRWVHNTSAHCQWIESLQRRVRHQRTRSDTAVVPVNQLIRLG